MLSQKFKAFLKQISVLTLLLAIFSFAITRFISPEFTTRTWPFLLLFFLITNSVLYYLYLRIHERKVSAFANFFMLTTSAKLIFYLMAIVVWLYFNRDETVPFVLTFFIYYIIYTIYEVRAIMKMQTGKDKSKAR